MVNGDETQTSRGERGELNLQEEVKIWAHGATDVTAEKLQYFSPA